jgi:hypothetical protein
MLLYSQCLLQQKHEAPRSNVEVSPEGVASTRNQGSVLLILELGDPLCCWEAGFAWPGGDFLEVLLSEGSLPLLEDDVWLLLQPLVVLGVMPVEEQLAFPPEVLLSCNGIASHVSVTG